MKETKFEVEVTHSRTPRPPSNHPDMDKAGITRYKFPIPSSLSFSAAPPNTRTRQGQGKGDDGVEKISARLRLLCKERRSRSNGVEGKAQDDKTWSQLVVRKREGSEKGAGALSSSLQTGLGDDGASYVKSRPETASRAELDVAMHGGDETRRKLEAMAVGAKPLEIEPKLGKKALKKAKRAEREKTKGAAWFGMGAPEMTEERRRDLEVLQMRNVADPKRFYKKNDLKVLPKYFQVGQVIDAPADFYSDRVPNKLRKKTLVDELMADAEFKKFNKRKYAEIIEKKEQTDRRHAAAARKRNRAEAKRRKREAKQKVAD